MRKIVLTYGLIAGAIVSVMILGSIPLWNRGILNFDNGEIVGYTTMVIALSMIFFGIKSCRDYHFKGSINFWQGVKIGLLITLIASIMYAITWEFSLIRWRRILLKRRGSIISKRQKMSHRMKPS